MKRKVNNSNKEKQTSGKFASIPLDDDTLRVDLYRAEHNYQSCLDRLDEPGFYGEDSMHPKNQATDSMNPKTCHTSHNDHPECPIPWQSPDSRILQEIPLPSPDFCWAQRIFWSQWLMLYHKGRYTGIQIRPMHTGNYHIVLGSMSLMEISTLRHAIATCHTIAWIFRDSLPVPRMRSKHICKRTEKSYRSQVGSGRVTTVERYLP